MYSRRPLTVQEVRRLALAGRVVPDPDYHAHVHGIRFKTILRLLPHVFRVVEDHRRDRLGRLRHPHGHICWTQDQTGDAYRIDFNLHHGTQDDDDSILVVTAMHLPP